MAAFKLWIQIHYSWILIQKFDPNESESGKKKILGSVRLWLTDVNEMIKIV